MIATLELVELRRGGGVLTAAVSAGAMVLPLDITLDYDEAGGLLELNGVTYAYTAVGEDFVTLATGLAADAAVDDPAWTVDAQGNREETWKAWVDLADGGDTVPALIPTELIGYFPEGDTAAGQAVEVYTDGDGYRVGNRPDQQALLDASFIDPTTAIPGGQAFSDQDPPADVTGYPEGYGYWKIVDGKVTGFWRLVAGVWTPQTIVTAEALVAGNVLVDALTGTTVTGTTVQSRAEQERGVKFGFVSGVEGIFAYDDAGNVFLKAVPAEGMAVVAGEIKANTTTVTEGTSLGGVTEITRAPDGTAGAVRLTGYTTAPKSAPTVTTGYDTVQFTDDGLWGDRRGWTTDGTYWYTARYDNHGGFVLERWNPTTGLLVASSGVHQGTVMGTVYHAGKLYTLANHRFNWRVYRNDATTLNYETIGIWPDFDSIEIDPNSPPRNPTIGVDSATGDLLIAQSRNSNNEKVRIRRWTMPATELDDLVSVGSAVNSTFGYPRDLAGVTYGTHDLGASRYIFSGNDAYRDYRVINSSGTTVSDEDWQSGMTGKVGFTYAERTVSVTRTTGSDLVTGTFFPTDVGSAINVTGFPTGTTIIEYINATTVRLSGVATSSGTTSPLVTGFKSMDKSGLMRAYTGQDKAVAIGSANLTKWVSNTLASATLETDQSPRAKITIPKRTKLNVTTSAINTGGANAPDRVKVYVGQGSTSPARTAMWKQTDPAVGVITTAYSSLATSGTNPPATNGFAAAAGTVQRLELADGTVFLDGVGGGTGWSTYNPTWTAATTNPVIGNGTITGRYARIGRNTIAFTIVLTVGSTTTMGSGNYTFGLPVAARDVNEIVPVGNQSGPNHLYIGRGPASGTGSTTTFQLFIASTETIASNTSAGLVSGSVLRISGTYEAA